MKSGKKIRLCDISDATGLSPATVDRAMNGRKGASERSINLVRKAISELGYKQYPEHLNIGMERTIRLLVILPASEQMFFLSIIRALNDSRQMVRGVNVELCLRRLNLDGRHFLIEIIDDCLKRSKEDRPQVVALFGYNVPGIRDAIERLRDAGIKVITLVADLPETARHYFVGVDNYQSGRTSGQLMSRLARRREGKVLVVSGFSGLMDQELRVRGVHDYLRSKCPTLSPMMTQYCSGSDQICEEIITRSLKMERDIVGVLVLGGGGEGLVRAIEANPEKMSNCCIIVYDWSQLLLKALKRGQIDAIIDQNTKNIARSCIRVACSLVENTPIIRSQERLDIGIIFSENMPSDLIQ